MASIFRNELAIMLGMLVANMFQGRIFKWRPPGYLFGQSYTVPYMPPLKEAFYGTGRGGYYRDHNGDSGRVGLPAENIVLPDPALSGSGGKLGTGGRGLIDGDFGNHMKFYNNIVQISAAGGGGWFSGGYSYLGGGGGGGSSFCLSVLGFNLLPAFIQNKIIQFYLSRLPEEVRVEMTEEDVNNYVMSFFGKWYDRESIAPTNYPFLYDLNTDDYEYIKRNNFEIFYDFRKKLAGNGAVLISTPDRIITYNKVEDYDPNNPKGEFYNLGYQFYYTGESQKWIVPEDGVYHIIAYGACGGDRFTGAGEMYLGGFGGCASGQFYFEAGTELIINVGGRGKMDEYGFYNSSKGFGGCTSGGSSSDVRYSNMYEESRILVAGGGGGIFAFSGDGEVPPDITEIPSNQVIEPSIGLDGEETEEELETRFQNMKFMVNDLSTVHVQVKSYNQLIVPDFAKTNCSIYLNDGEEGELHTSVTPGGGVYVHEYQFKLNKIYPPNTPTHEVTIEAIIKSNFYSIIANNGVTIWVTTDFRPSDSLTDNPIVIGNYFEDLDCVDFCEYEKTGKRILTLEIEEALGIDDFYEWVMNTAGGQKDLDITELFNIDDFYETVNVRPPDKDDPEYSDIEIDDDFVVSLVHLEYLYKDINEILEIDDYIEVDLVKEE